MEIIEINSEIYPEIAKIYEEGIATGIATFEIKAKSWQMWDESHLPFGRLAIIENDKILAWAALSPVSSRCVYAGVAEVSIYVALKARGKGMGYHLLEKLVEISEENKIWTLQSGIFIENIPSISLHKKCGFRIIGYKEKIGQLNGIWKDNLLLERRSKTVGI